MFSKMKRILSSQKATKLCFILLFLLSATSTILLYLGFLGLEGLIVIIELTISLVAIVLDVGQRRLENRLISVVTGLSSIEYELIKYVEGKPRTLKEISKKLGTNQANVNVIINRLEQRELIISSTRQSSTYYTLSEKGRSIVALHNV